MSFNLTESSSEGKEWKHFTYLWPGTNNTLWHNELSHDPINKYKIVRRVCVLFPHWDVDILMVDTPDHWMLWPLDDVVDGSWVVLGFCSDITSDLTLQLNNTLKYDVRNKKCGNNIWSEFDLYLHKVEVEENEMRMKIYIGQLVKNEWDSSTWHPPTDLACLHHNASNIKKHRFPFVFEYKIFCFEKKNWNKILI